MYHEITQNTLTYENNYFNLNLFKKKKKNSTLLLQATDCVRMIWNDCDKSHD